jgi:hypothetical protein
MILDGLEGDPSAGCDAAGWFLCCGLWKIHLAKSHSFAGQYPCIQPTKDPNHSFPTTTIDLDTSNG